MNVTTVPALVLVSIMPCAAVGSTEDAGTPSVKWQFDYAVAMEQAAQQGVPMAVYFADDGNRPCSLFDDHLMQSADAIARLNCCSCVRLPLDAEIMSGGSRSGLSSTRLSPHWTEAPAWSSSTSEVRVLCLAQSSVPCRFGTVIPLSFRIWTSWQSRSTANCGWRARFSGSRIIPKPLPRQKQKSGCCWSISSVRMARADADSSKQKPWQPRRSLMV